MTDTATVFVALTRPQTDRLAGGEGVGAVAGYADTPGLRRASGLGPAQQEEAGYVTLGHAGLAALLLPGPRLVVAADVASAQLRGGDDPFGTVEVTDLRWSQVQAVFADDPAAAADLDRVRRSVHGRTVAEFAADQRIVDLLEPWDLLWFAPQELDELDR